MAIPIAAALLFAVPEASAWNTARRVEAEIRGAEEALEELRRHDCAAVLKGELSLLEGSIDDAAAALAARKHRLASMLAERLPRRVILLRALLAVAEEEARLATLEEEAEDLRRELAVLRGRLDRMALRQRGRAATWAYPPPGSAMETP